ncbi:hypothetical protein CRG98_009374 [Punica granatum]|uniref:Uncharacterized protein n=1 Tax=Punica granatum TaxID=22663 RepID=A0A2I0KP37_PUNGR|nr:hypothetical protein CRG98_009374 [Punica granatum]
MTEIQEEKECEHERKVSGLKSEKKSGERERNESSAMEFDDVFLEKMPLTQRSIKWVEHQIDSHSYKLDLLDTRTNPFEKRGNDMNHLKDLMHGYKEKSLEDGVGHYADPNFVSSGPTCLHVDRTVWECPPSRGTRDGHALEGVATTYLRPRGQKSPSSRSSTTVDFAVSVAAAPLPMAVVILDALGSIRDKIRSLHFPPHIGSEEVHNPELSGTYRTRLFGEFDVCMNDVDVKYMF